MGVFGSMIIYLGNITADSKEYISDSLDYTLYSEFAIDLEVFLVSLSPKNLLIASKQNIDMTCCGRL